MTSLTGLIRHFKLALMGRQPWDKDLIIFLALKGRHIILIQRHCPSRGGKVPSPLVGKCLGEGYFRINTILGESMPNIETDTPDIFSRIMSEKKSVLPNHININQADVSKGLAKLVLTIIELLRELLERQAIRRIDSGTLTREEVNNLGTTFMKLAEKMEELKTQFGLKTEDLNIDLGPLGKLL